MPAVTTAVDLPPAAASTTDRFDPPRNTSSFLPSADISYAPAPARTVFSSRSSSLRSRIRIDDGSLLPRAGLRV